ncbi:MAG: YcaO-like family protein [Parcubacteria group bacterium]|nr:YcaO-like family protein [Parcubacteria group bacterium]
MFETEAYRYYSPEARRDFVEVKNSLLGSQCLDRNSAYFLQVARRWMEKELGGPLYVLSGDPVGDSINLLYFFDKRGFLEDAYFRPLFTDFPKAHSAYVRFVPPKDKTDGSLLEEDAVEGFALGFTKADVLFRATVECAERYCLLVYRNASLHVSMRGGSGGDNAFDPSRFTSFSDTQIDSLSTGLGATSVFRWVRAKEIICGKEAYVPAQWVYVNYRKLDQEPRLVQQTSSGAAGGTSFEGAAYRAICELIERDAFLIFYLNRLSPSRVALSSIPSEDIQTLARDLRRYKVEIHVLDISTDLKVPSFAAILIDRSGVGPAVSVGLRSDLDQISGITGAIREALQTSCYTRDLMELRKANPETGLGSRERPLGLGERRLFWARQESIDMIDFFFKGEERSFSNKSNLENQSMGESRRLRALLSRLKGSIKDIFLVDITYPPFRKFPLSVVKSVIPDVVPLYLNEKYAGWENDRLKNVPPKLGFKPATSFNEIPHPFI